ncbi:GntR family transcriptional regulator [Bifidobacterium avesanii]|uniref:GntR family transcriptional regulator n=1 Tax=Bifidobacterium avesanii TaxID=1798157 RepID=A0A7K3TFK0_9BIFI|nr:GntR family transcriptional regulator [Bifidobacterium avesanii]KAB8291503.1 transcriptional regulator [Bifidobacterium avesanii]NEG77868.1 GntR family transcriptional regulator [Bifidobacterium avesanii]
MSASGNGLRVAIRDDAPTPVYEQIRSQIEAAIRGGALEDGDKLPSVRQLAGDLRIAPGTVAKAYGELAEQGLIDTGLGRTARVRKVAALPEPLLDAARTFAGEARRLGVGFDEAVSALRARW